jgi:S1-C subfamily serine protease
MMFLRVVPALCALLLGTAAIAAEPDRSSLSFEDNVTINTACYSARAKGSGPFVDCVKAQLAALPAHPAPDRTALADGQVRTIEGNCAYLRRISLAQYNDCLTKAVSGTPVPKDDDEKDNLASNAMLTKAITDRSAKDGVVQAAVVTLPLPKAALSAQPQHIGRAVLSPAELFKKVERSIFVVGAARSVGDARARDIMQGSAVAVADHLLLTNCHVVANRPVIVLLQDHIVYRAHLVGSDEPHDRCVLQSEGSALVPVEGVRSYDDVSVGERVFAIGTPKGLERTLSEGLVSGKRFYKGRNLIQTSAPISHGSSGGGLFDDRGNLLGITSMGMTDGQNLDFAVAAADYWQ